MKFFLVHNVLSCLYQKMNVVVYLSTHRFPLTECFKKKKKPDVSPLFSISFMNPELNFSIFDILES